MNAERSHGEARQAILSARSGVSSRPPSPDAHLGPATSNPVTDDTDTGIPPLRDPIQEFAERVAEKWENPEEPCVVLRGLANLIASELRAGGWIPPWTGWRLEDTANGGQVGGKVWRPL